MLSISLLRCYKLSNASKLWSIKSLKSMTLKSMTLKSMYSCSSIQYSNSSKDNSKDTSKDSSKDSKLFSKFKYNMDKEVYTIPNMITMSRIVSSPFLTYAIINDMKYTALIGCCVFGFTDWLDGYVAKNYNQMSVLGAFLDPVADKVLIGALSIGLCYKGLIPLALASVIIGRDVLLVLGAFTLRARERPDGSPFFDTTYSATFEIAPSTLSKVNTGFQFLLLASTIGNFGLGIPTLSYIEPLWWITAVTTFGSGIGYLDGTGIRRLSQSGIGRLGKKLDEYEKKQQ